MFSQVRKFLFKCKDCSLILLVEFEEDEDIETVIQDEMTLDCLCKGKCHGLLI